jgi:ankyrin repeat protein
MRRAPASSKGRTSDLAEFPLVTTATSQRRKSKEKMGLKQEENNVPSQQSPADVTPQADAPRSAQLPPEAVALAGKLFDFAREGKTAELEQYISHGIPVNLTNHKGDTLVMLAAYHGHLETLKMLLDKGADMDVLNERGQSPIAGAVFKGYDEVVALMAQRGADLHAGQPNAVQAAHMFKREEMLRVFGEDESSV